MSHINKYIPILLLGVCIFINESYLLSQNTGIRDIKYYNDSVINTYINNTYSVKCKKTPYAKYSKKKEKKDSMCIDAFLDIYHFVKSNEKNNDLKVISNYLKSKKYKFALSFVKENCIYVDFDGGHINFGFSINIEERQIGFKFIDSENCACDNQTFMDFFYLRDKLIGRIPLKLTIVYQDFLDFDGHY